MSSSTRTCSLLRELILFEENLFSSNVVEAAWALMGRNTCKSNTMWWYTCQACEKSFTTVRHRGMGTGISDLVVTRILQNNKP